MQPISRNRTSAKPDNPMSQLCLTGLPPSTLPRFLFYWSFDCCGIQMARIQCFTVGTLGSAMINPLTGWTLALQSLDRVVNTDWFRDNLLWWKRGRRGREIVIDDPLSAIQVRLHWVHCALNRIILMIGIRPSANHHSSAEMRFNFPVPFSMEDSTHKVVRNPAPFERRRD